MPSSGTEDWPVQSAQSRDSVSSDDLEEPQSGQDSNSTALQAQHQPSMVPEYSQSPGSSSPTKLGDIDYPVSPSANTGSDNAHISSPWPSKFHGHYATWQTWTAGDRAIATSLDQLRATDLSVHLYNAYSLKRSAKIQATANKDAKHDTSLWHPRRLWTAWPMPMEEVPRDVVQALDQADRSEDVYCTTDVDSRPSIELMDSLNAVISQEAKHRFRRRESRDGSQELETSLQVEDLQTSSNRPDDTGFKRSKKSHDDTYRSSINLVQAYPKLPGEQRMVFKPILMADDEIAASILQPSVRHTLTKLDDLLMGLHHSRQEVANGPPRVERRRPEDYNGSSSFENEAISSTHKLQRRKKLLHLRERRLGLRDWGDVLGIASLTDWEPSVLNRAANRCAALFSEGINFRTLSEGKDEATEISHLPLDLGANKATTSSENHSTHDTNSGPIKRAQGQTARVIDGKPCCPIPSCEWFRKGFSNKHILQKHMIRLHAQEEMVGAVHVDGFLRPIRRRKIWRDEPSVKSQLPTTGGT
ncbi:hypothetical protein MMC14_001384 [Varicellaria rhodocarpa]|nr:hypothetical protein [Varicellaria rhodocarpa]